MKKRQLLKYIAATIAIIMLSIGIATARPGGGHGGSHGGGYHGGGYHGGGGYTKD